MLGGPRCLLWRTTFDDWELDGIGTLSSRHFEFCSTLIHSCLSLLHWTFSDQTNNHDVVDVFCHVMTGSF